MSCIGSASILGLTGDEVLKICPQTADFWLFKEPKIVQKLGNMHLKVPGDLKTEKFQSLGPDLNY